MRWLTLLLAVLMAACAGPKEYFVDADFSPTQQELVREAARRWNYAADNDNLIVVTDVWPAGGFDLSRDWTHATERVVHLVDRGSSDYQVLSAMAAGGVKFDGIHNRFNGTILLVNETLSGKPVNDSSFLTVAMHEFGHALGLRHTEYGLMAAEGATGTCIDDALVEELCERNDCGRFAGMDGCWE